MEKCRKCGNEFDPSELPPSLRQTLKRCKKCYTAKKKQIDKDWRKDHKPRIRTYNRRKELALKEDYGEANYNKIKTLRWKIRSMYYRIKKSKTIETEVKLKRALKEMRIDLALLCKGENTK